MKRDYTERLRRGWSDVAKRLLGYPRKRVITCHVSRFTDACFTVPDLLWRNPLIVRFARARLRRQHLIPVAMGVLIAGGWIVKELSLDTARDAVTFLGTIAAILLGDAWSASAEPAMPLLVTLYGLVAAALLLTLAVTPGAGAFATGARRGDLKAWTDLSPNWAPLGAFCVIILLAGVAAGRAPAAAGLPSARAAAASGAAALTVFWGGCAKQFFDLRFGRRGAAYAALSAGFIWLFPLLIAGLMETRSGASVEARQAVAGVSSIFGVVLAARAGEPGTGHLGSATALIAGTALAALFAMLRLRAEWGIRQLVKRET